MPIHISYDTRRHMPYVQWGTKTKYYFNYNNMQSYRVALRRAHQQMKAIYSSGYHKK